ncbi:hypothetical protein QYB59_001448 [Clostridium perfringens]|nr:hypothetical protein [Clostridium perfringens]
MGVFFIETFLVGALFLTIRKIFSMIKLKEYLEKCNWKILSPTFSNFRLGVGAVIYVFINMNIENLKYNNIISGIVFSIIFTLIHFLDEVQKVKES